MQSSHLTLFREDESEQDACTDAILDDLYTHLVCACANRNSSGQEVYTEAIAVFARCQTQDFVTWYEGAWPLHSPQRHRQVQFGLVTPGMGIFFH